MVLKIDMAPFVIAAHHSTRFHQNSMKELVANAAKAPTEEGCGP